ncbi:hypothetical protein [uncultured Sphingomonas sp.]|uniref:hypothetical protein n=1 Tax=uncultured Sphingomonas sp. TaxID=158754 RepID=UPI0035CBABAF
MIRAFFATWGGAFRDTAELARRLPLLIAAMVAVELIQHVVEVKVGMFGPVPADRKAASMDAVRLGFGWTKMAAVFALDFFATRYFVTRDTVEAMRPSRHAGRRYLGVAAFQAVIAAVVIYAAGILALFGIGEDRVMALRFVAASGQQLLEPLLMLWYANAAMGTHAYGPLRSARATGWFYPWALLLIFVARLPFSAAHQMLNRWPAGKGAGLLWPALVLDAVIVGIMVALLAAIQVRIARFIADQRGVALLGKG